MKPKNTLRILSGSLATLLFTHSVQATTLYWDINQTTDNVAVAITGAWDGATNNWNDDATGGGAGSITATTSDADDLVFSSGSVYTTGIVTTSGFQAASSLTFEDNIAVSLAATLVQSAAAVTADSGPDTFSYTGTTVLDGQVVSFGGTPPAGLKAGQLYYIVNATASEYQVSNTAGGPAIDFTDNGTSVTNTVRAALTIGGTGAKSGIFVNDLISNATNISAPIILAANSTFQNASNAALNITGGISGTADLTLNANYTTRSTTSGGSGGIAISGTSVNHIGKIINSGNGAGIVSISAAIGSNVTEIRQDSNTSQLQITGGITVNSGGTTLTSNGFQAFSLTSNGISGTGNLILNNNSLYTSAMGSSWSGTGFIPNGIQIGANAPVNHVGSITNSGTGYASASISGVIGVNVTGITQNSAGSNLLLFGSNTAFAGPTAINAGILGAGNANALGTGGTITFGGGTLQYIGHATDLSARFAATGDSPYSIDTNGQNPTFATGLVASGTSGFTKLGAGTLILSGDSLFTGTTTIGGGTGTLQKLTGGILQVGNGSTGSLNGTAGTDLTFKGTGTFNVSAAAGVDQGMGALTFTAGAATVQSTYAGTPGVDTSVLSFSSLAARGTGATGNFVLSGGTPVTDNQITLGSGVAADSFIDKGIYYGGGSYAWKDTGGYVRAIVYGTDTGTFSSGAATTLDSTFGTHQQMTGAITAQSTDTFGTLNISGGSNLTLAGGATLTVDGLLKTGGTAAVISGGTGIRPSSGAEWVIRNEDALAITSPILANGTNALTKSGAGTLKLSGSYGLTGDIAINEGALQLDLANDKSLSGTLSGTGNLIKTGTGKLTLNGSAATFSGNLQINNSTVVLDMSGMATPVNMLNPGSRITWSQTAADSVANGVARGGGTLIIKGKSTGITTQVLSQNSISKAGFTVNTGTSRVLVDPNGGTETQVLIGWLGAVSAGGNRNYGGAFVIGKANDGTSNSQSSINGNIVFTEDANNTNLPSNGGQMYGRVLWAWNGGVAGTDMDFITASPVSSNNPMNLYPTGTLGTSYPTLANNTNDTANHYKLTGSLTAVSTLAFHGLKISDLADDNQSLTLVTTGNQPRGGILLTGDKDFLITGGSMSTPTTGGDGSILILQYGTGVLTISTVLDRNGNGSFTKSGPGKLVLSGLNTYTGTNTTTYFNEGIVQANSVETAGTSGPFGKDTGAGRFAFAGGTLQYSSVNQFDYSSRFGTAGGEPIKIDTFGQTVTFASNLQGTATELTLNDTAVTKGTLTLSGTNSYTGPTTVSAGTLRINGANNGTGAVTVASGATLGGIGTIAGSTTISGNHAPGLSAGIQTFSNGLAYLASSTLKWELNDDVSEATTGVRGTDFDGVDVTGGAFSITSNATIDLSFGGLVDFLDSFWDTDQSWKVVDLSGSVTGDGGSELFTLGTFTGATPSGGSFNVSRVSDGTWNDVFLNWVASAGGPSYATWAAAFSSPVLSDQAADADPDFDGLDNALEYVIGSDPRVSNQGGPTGGVVGTNLVMNLTRKDSSETADVGLLVEVSTDLVDWTTITGYTIGADTATSTSGVVVTENLAADDTISVTIPKGADLKKFARLRVVITP